MGIWEAVARTNNCPIQPSDTSSIGLVPIVYNQLMAGGRDGRDTKLAYIRPSDERTLTEQGAENEALVGDAKITRARKKLGCRYDCA